MLRLLFIAMLGTLQLTSPKPLLMGSFVERQPIEWRWTGECGDVGAYEYVTPFVPLQEGDSCIDGQITLDDIRWCRFCFNGPEIPMRQYVRVKATGELVPINCWLCDLDGDDDVDLRDFACHSAQVIP